MSDQKTLAEAVAGIHTSTTSTSTKGGNVSVETDSMDTMIESASTPSLATLFQRGKDAGLLKPTTGYGE